MVVRSLVASFAVVALVLCSAPLAAQSPAPADVSAIIAASGGSDLFTVADAAKGLAQHVRSGMICAFEPGQPANRITIYHNSLPRGDDVACNTRYRDINLLLIATRYPGRVTENDVLAKARAELHGVRRNLVPFAGSVPEISNDVHALVERYSFEQGGTTFFTRIAVAKRGDWIVTEFIYSPQAIAGAANLYASTALQRAVAGMGPPR